MQLSEEVIAKVATDLTLKAFDEHQITLEENTMTGLAKALSVFFNTVVEEISKAQN